MIISHRHKFIFIHICKVAGTSISHALRPYTSWPCESLTTKLLQKFGYLPASQHFGDHVTAGQLRDLMDRKIYEHYYKFAFVRNPWDWQVSLYEYILRNPVHHKHPEVKAMSGFEEYLHWRFSQPKHKPWNMQKNFVTDLDGNLIVDFIGRYEHLHDDFNVLLKNLGLKAKLPHLNQGTLTDYQQYYTETTANLLSEYYREDIEMFGYHPPVLDLS
jgi:hypothetical protein